MNRPGEDPRLVELDAETVAVLRAHARAIAASGRSDAPWTTTSVFRPPPGMTPAQGLALLAAMVFVLLSALASSSLVEAVGVRGCAAGLLGVAACAAIGLRGAEVPGGIGIGIPERFALFGVLIAALASGSDVVLALLPAAVHAAVARMMFASLRAPRTVIEIGARLSHPLAPAFISPYCRKLTVVWGLSFGASAAVAATLALGGRMEAHRAWTGWQFWSLLGIFSAVEFFFRKAWFRYYGKGPLDRMLASLLPPERTERGRRSQAWLLRMREELARMANEETARG